MEQLNIYTKAPTRLILKEILEEKGITCIGYTVRDPYLRINLGNNSFYTFREVKGQKFVYLDKENLSALRLVPKEAIIPFLLDVAR